MTETPEAPAHRTSYSAINQHRVCPQRWAYARLRRLEKPPSEDITVERDLGSWMHMLLAADSLMRGFKLGSLKWIPEELTSVNGGPTLAVTPQITPQDVVNLAVPWWERQSPEVREQWIERLGEGLPERMVYLYETWKIEHAEQRATEEPLAVELRWERELPMPVGYEPVIIVGYVDEIFRSTKYNIITARDWKIHKKLSTQTSADDMHDSQLQVYAWGAWPAVQAWGVGRLESTAYDRLRSVKPVTPAVTATGNLAKTPSDYDRHTYRSWARGEDGQGVPWGKEGEFYKTGKKVGEPKFGRYTVEEKVMNALSAPGERSTWFQRTGPTPMNTNVIRGHLEAAVATAKKMQDTREEFVANGAAGRNLFKENCRYCDFSKLCRAELYGGVSGTYDLAEMNLREKEKSA